MYPHAGLQNIGATCYMNACLQSLANDTDFVKSFLEEVALKYNKLDLKNNENKLVLELANVMQNLWNLPFKNGDFDPNTYYGAYEFQKILVQCNPLFQAGAPGDSKDLLIYLFETIHRVLCPNNEIFYGKDMNNTIQYFGKNKSCAYNSFYFVTQSKMKCQLCGNVNNGYQITNLLVFPLEEVRKMKQQPQMLYNNFIFDNNAVTIDDCFAYDNRIYYLTGDNRIYCNECRQMSNAICQNAISYTPNTLAILLNRGKGNIYNVQMPIPENIDLQNCVQYKTIDGEMYFLSSVICHKKSDDNNSYSNHFITLAKTTPDSPWVRYNDSFVNTLEDSNGEKYMNEVLSGNSKVTPYILFYKKMNSTSKNDSNLLKKVYKVQPNVSEINQPQNKFNNANGFYNMYGMYNQNYYMNNMMMGMNYNNNQ